MIAFKINTSKGKIEVHAKSSWEELTVNDHMQIEGKKKLNIIDVFNVVTGLDVELLNGLVDPKTYDKLKSICGFVMYQTPDWESLKPPTKIIIGGKAYKTPLDFNKTMWGQKGLFENMVIDKNQDLIKNMAKVVAIYMQPVMNEGVFDDDKMEETEQLIMEAQAVPVFALAQFFFLQSPDLTLLGIRDFQPSHKQKERMVA